MAVVMWFRQDLRLADNPALAAAVATGQPIIPLYCLDDLGDGDWPMGAAQRWWLHESLAALDAALHQRGSRLVLRRGVSDRVLRELSTTADVSAIYWNRRYEPAVIERDRAIKASLESYGIEGCSSNGSLLNEPWEIRNQAGKPFQVFTPYWRHCLKRDDPIAPLAVPKQLTGPANWPATLPLAALELLPRMRWYEAMARQWQPGERGAATSLRQFVQSTVWSYAENRNLPAIDGTSQLSPHLHFGEVSPRQIWHAVRKRAEQERIPAAEWRTNQFLTEVYWREFAYHLLWHFPHTPSEPLRTEFKDFPWAAEDAQLTAWQRGRTGIPMVDAGMRELWATGWMHNRVRMIVASFLVKNLLVPWQDGARWFWDTLVDADLASNTAGWQWCAGSGADAAPYFRIFNPVSQGEKFDPEGAYVRTWVPELAKLPEKYIHAPWTAPADVLSAAGVRLDHDYPAPIVDLKETRDRALNAYQTMRGTAD
ncbi:MAG TPA: deoxyribodipyrimidine photo-lyase [Steroidobacteraceae bacterium]|nr:deoxyribodipyrimidine photo-lyase [Steroidobacteraceae bacterium]HRX90161.1 deoxyribodipyrimidine photo-lyase [Steroidobacteraceae bacterium]